MVSNKSPVQSVLSGKSSSSSGNHPPVGQKISLFDEEKGGTKFLTIFLDAYDDVLNSRLKVRGGTVDRAY